MSDARTATVMIDDDGHAEDAAIAERREPGIGDRNRGAAGEQEGGAARHAVHAERADEGRHRSFEISRPLTMPGMMATATPTRMPTSMAGKGGR